MTKIINRHLLEEADTLSQIEGDSKKISLLVRQFLNANQTIESAYTDAIIVLVEAKIFDQALDTFDRFKQKFGKPLTYTEYAKEQIYELQKVKLEKDKDEYIFKRKPLSNFSNPKRIELKGDDITFFVRSRRFTYQLNSLKYHVTYIKYGGVYGGNSKERDMHITITAPDQKKFKIQLNVRRQTYSNQKDLNRYLLDKTLGDETFRIDIYSLLPKIIAIVWVPAVLFIGIGTIYALKPVNLSFVLGILLLTVLPMPLSIITVKVTEETYKK